MRVEGLSKQYRSASGDVEVFDRFSLVVPEGEITVILGPSGCGKTTLLHCIAGLAAPDAGAVVREDFPVASADSDSLADAPGIPAREPSLSFIFQEPRLLPWMTVERNIDFVLGDAVSAGEERRKRIFHVLELVGLQDCAHRFPDELSGGMRQRAAIARAFAYPSSLILMDEPFQSIDLKLRIELIGGYLRLWREDRRTTLMVTHDIREALLMADAVVLLSERPARVTHRFEVPVPRRGRILGDRSLLELEEEIYRALGIA